MWVRLTPTASTMLPKFDPREVKVIPEVCGVEVSAMFTLAPKIGSLGLFPKKIDYIVKATGDLEGCED